MLRQLWTMTSFDLRQRLRDKSVVLFALVVPLALMSVLHLIMGNLIDDELEPVTVAIAAEADGLGAGIRGALESTDLDLTLDERSADAVRDDVDAGRAELGIIVPTGPEGTHGQPAEAGGSTDGDEATVTVVAGDSGGPEVGIVLAVVRAAVDRHNAVGVVGRAGGALDLAPNVLGDVTAQVGAGRPDIGFEEGRAPSEQLGAGASLVAGQAGLFLIFTVSFGVLGLIAEREQGTMPRLRSMPMPTGLIVAAKALVGLVLGFVATSVLLLLGSWLFDISFGPAPLVGLVVLAAVVAATSLIFLIARVARTGEQASIAQTIFAVVLGIAGGSFFPIAATGWGAVVLDLNPIAAFVRGLGITAGGGGLDQLGTPLVTMLGFAAVMALAARLVPDRGVTS